MATYNQLHDGDLLNHNFQNVTESHRRHVEVLRRTKEEFLLGEESFWQRKQAVHLRALVVEEEVIRQLIEDEIVVLIVKEWDPAV